MRIPRSLMAVGLMLAVAALLARPAAAELRTNGKMSLDLSMMRSPVDENWVRMIGSRLDLNAEFYPGDRDNARLVVQTSGSAHNMSNSQALSIVPAQFQVRSSYLEVTTSLWAGGPPWLVRMGDQHVSWSSLIRSPGDRTGFALSNVNIRGINTRWLYLWGDVDDLATSAIQTSKRVGNSMLSGTYVSSGPHNQIVLEGNTVAFDGLVEVQAGVSLDGGHVNAARTVLGWDVAPNVSVEGRYDVQENYDPLRTAYDPLDPMLKQRARMQLAVSTRQLGTQWSARTEMQDGTVLRTTLSAQRPFVVSGHTFRSSYGATLQGEQISHSVTGQTSLDLGVFRGVGLMASMGWGNGMPTWRAQVSYAVSSGPSFNMTYDQSQRTTFRTAVSLSF